MPIEDRTYTTPGALFTKKSGMILFVAHQLDFALKALETSNGWFCRLHVSLHISYTHKCNKCLLPRCIHLRTPSNQPNSSTEINLFYKWKPLYELIWQISNTPQIAMCVCFSTISVWWRSTGATIFSQSQRSQHGISFSSKVKRDNPRMQCAAAETASRWLMQLPVFRDLGDKLLLNRQIWSWSCTKVMNHEMHVS